MDDIVDIGLSKFEQTTDINSDIDSDTEFDINDVPDPEGLFKSIK